LDKKTVLLEGNTWNLQSVSIVEDLYLSCLFGKSFAYFFFVPCPRMLPGQNPWTCSSSSSDSILFDIHDVLYLFYFLFFRILWLNMVFLCDLREDYSYLFVLLIFYLVALNTLIPKPIWYHRENAEV